MFATTTIPDGWVVNQYEQWMGRLPTTAELNATLQALQNQCTHDNLKTTARRFLLSPEFINKGYSKRQQIQAIYRSVLFRDADPVGLDYWATYPTGSDAFEGIANTAEAQQASQKACDSSTQPKFNATPAFPIGETQASLQARLNQGGVVAINPGDAIAITTPLIVPAGTTLVTAGEPSPGDYLKFGRLYRVGQYAGPVVDLRSGAKLRSVWVDGQRHTGIPRIASAINVRMLGGVGATVGNTRQDSTAGATTIETYQGRQLGYSCEQTVIAKNNITVTSSSNTGENWSDAISNACEDALITQNTVLDATDVGVILFQPVQDAARPQKSRVLYNRIWNITNNTFGMVGIDPYNQSGGNCDRYFQGTVIGNNELYTGSRANTRIGITVGTVAWFGKNSCRGSGGTVAGNYGSIAASVGTAVGLYQNDVLLNNPNLAFRQSNHPKWPSSCPRGAIASGVQALTGCIQP